jgi:putative restriction endonuclease
MDHDALAKKWLAKLTKLNPATGRGECHGKAPHKPLLLLALIDMAENGELNSRSFARSPGLVLRFRSYGSITTDRWPNRLDLRLPFYHLSSQGFWEPFDAEMRLAKSPEACSVCDIAPELYELLADPGFRLKARMVLINKFFSPHERIALFETLGIQYNEITSAVANDTLPYAFLPSRDRKRCGSPITQAGIFNSIQPPNCAPLSRTFVVIE